VQTLVAFGNVIGRNAHAIADDSALHFGECREKVQQKPPVQLDEACPKCGKPLLQRDGQYGEFIACSGYPKCKTSMDADAEGNPVKPIDTGVKCDKCQSPMIVKRGFRGPFLSCSGYPSCKEAYNLDAEGKPVPSVVETDHVCEKCGKPMVIKWGRNGHFLACSGYPDCRNTKEYTRNADGTLTVVSTTRASDQICPTCGSAMVIKRGRFGEFIACSRYPDCKTTSPISLGVDCPKEGCGGYLTEKRSKRGKVFFGCSNYSKTQCDFVSWDRPIPEPCPKCGATMLLARIEPDKPDHDKRTFKCSACEHSETMVVKYK
jgi:ssDNA-binding Zn-finger/Zn-ribbon topoisomerase 1